MKKILKDLKKLVMLVKRKDQPPHHLKKLLLIPKLNGFLDEEVQVRQKKILDC